MSSLPSNIGVDVLNIITQVIEQFVQSNSETEDEGEESSDK